MSTSFPSQVVYDLLEFLVFVNMSFCLLFGCLSASNQIEQDLASLLTMEHADVMLFTAYLAIKPLQQIRDPDQRDQRSQKVHLEIA